MILVDSFITDKDGNIKDVIMPYNTYKKIESLLLDTGLGKAMAEVSDEEDFSLDEARILIRDIDDGSV